MTPWGIRIRVRDDVGALERLLGLVRRRAMPLRTESIARDAQGRWSVVLELTSNETSIERLRDEFIELHDLEDAVLLHAERVAPDA